MLLSELKQGDRAIMLNTDSGELEIALMKMGMIRGDSFLVSAMAPFGGPIALCLDGSKIALRKSDAAKVHVSRVDE